MGFLKTEKTIPHVSLCLSPSHPFYAVLNIFFRVLNILYIQWGFIKLKIENENSRSFNSSLLCLIDKTYLVSKFQHKTLTLVKKRKLTIS